MVDDSKCDRAKRSAYFAQGRPAVHDKTSMVSRHGGPVLMRQNVVDFL
jgi:hypothetical protein